MTVRIPIKGGIWGEEVVVISNVELVENITYVAWPVREFKSFRSRSGYGKQFYIHEQS